jgi:hypothetical protein
MGECHQTLETRTREPESELSESQGRSEQAAKAARAEHARMGESLPTVNAKRCEERQRRERGWERCLTAGFPDARAARDQKGGCTKRSGPNRKVLSLPKWEWLDERRVIPGASSVILFHSYSVTRHADTLRPSIQISLSSRAFRGEPLACDGTNLRGAVRISLPGPVALRTLSTIVAGGFARAWILV